MNRIRDLREDFEMKQSDLARELKISQRTISDYETERTEPSKEIWIKIANFFNVSVDYLMGRTNNPSTESFTEGLSEEEIKELMHYKELLQIKRKVENNKKISTLTKGK